MSFISGFTPPAEISKDAFWFVFLDHNLLVIHEEENVFVPVSRDLESFNLMPEKKQYLGMLDGRQCYTAALPHDLSLPGHWTCEGLRKLFSRLEKELVLTAGMANQLNHWQENHTYCGRCGHLTDNKTDERAKVCPECGLINYSRLSPAVIVAVLKDHQILLAHSQRFPTKFYSVLAGFVEPGETLEECVEREILEEVGIAVKNIRYFGSQPWPFPDSLMIGFTAEYAGGELEVDHREILDAGWFSADNLPPIPPKISIARRLIDWFIEQSG